MEWDWQFVIEILPVLIEGVKITILATFLSFFLAAILGLPIALVRRSKHRWLARLVGVAADFIRGTPLLVQLYFLFFVLPGIGINLPALVAGIVGLGLHNSTYLAEVYRAGIENVQRGQWEAAKACNLSRAQTWRHIILPQAIPPMIPAMGNYLVAMFKDTPLLSAITVVELMGAATRVASTTYRYIEPITLIGAFFLVISLASAVGLRVLERRVKSPS